MPAGSAGRACRRSAYASTWTSTARCCTASNHNLDGYWDQPEETAKAQAGGWFHTGDGGYIDDEGYLVISDRKKDVIISGGENVSSIEVEDVITSHPAVREVAVIGIPDEKWGELVTALVVTDGSDVTAEELIAHCRTQLAGFKTPEAGRLRRVAAAHGDREAAEVQAARAVLAGATVATAAAVVRDGSPPTLGARAGSDAVPVSARHRWLNHAIAGSGLSS